MSRDLRFRFLRDFVLHIAPKSVPTHVHLISFMALSSRLLPKLVHSDSHSAKLYLGWREPLALEGT